MTAKEKRELYALPIAPAPTMEIEAKTIVTEKNSYDDNTYTRTVTNYLYGVTECGEETLALTVYTAAGVPLFRTFQTPKAIAAQYLGEKARASTTTLWNAKQINSNCYGKNDGLHGTAEDDKRLYALLDNKYPLYLHRQSEENGYHFLARYQQRLREYDLEQKYNKIRAEYDNEMLEIRPLPQKVNAWVDSALMKQSRYIFYDYKKGKRIMTGRCSHCGQTVKINHPHHKAAGSCPHCHSAVTYLARGKFTTGYGADVTDRRSFTYFQSTKAGWCLRCFEVTAHHYADHAAKPKDLYSYHEYLRRFYRSDDRMREQSSFGWENFRNTGEYRFCKNSYAHSGETYIYPANLDKLLRPTDRYTPYRDIARLCGRLNAIKLVESTPANKQVEYIFKLGLFRLCADAINGNLCGSLEETGKTFFEIFGLPKSDLPQLRELNPDGRELNIYRLLREKNKQITNELYRRVIEIDYHCNYSAKFTGLFEYQTAAMVLQYIEKQFLQHQLLTPKAPSYCCGAYGARAETAEERANHIRNDIICDWADYIGECRQLKLDLTDTLILRPRDLAAAHEKTSAEVQTIRNKQEAERKAALHRAETKKIKLLAEQLTEQFAFAADGLFIRPFMTAEEVVREGNLQHHCVGGYTGDYADGRTYLFCIRNEEAPDKPYYTLELNPKTGTVAQYRGYRNDAPNRGKQDPAATAFVQKWTAKVVKPIYQKREKAEARVQVSA